MIFIGNLKMVPEPFLTAKFEIAAGQSIEQESRCVAVAAWER